MHLHHMYTQKSNTRIQTHTLPSLFGVACTHVSREEFLVLDSQSGGSSLEKALFFSPVVLGSNSDDLGLCEILSSTQ